MKRLLIIGLMVAAFSIPVLADVSIGVRSFGADIVLPQVSFSVDDPRVPSLTIFKEDIWDGLVLSGDYNLALTWDIPLIRYEIINLSLYGGGGVWAEFDFPTSLEFVVWHGSMGLTANFNQAGSVFVGAMIFPDGSYELSFGGAVSFSLFKKLELPAPEVPVEGE